MKLLETPSFIRSAKFLIKKYPELLHDIKLTLQLLSEDPFANSLKTHKLKGKLKGSFACSVTYDIRIVFQFVGYQENGISSEAILLEAIGSHDDVY